jgi:hypothetical protein
MNLENLTFYLVLVSGPLALWALYSLFRWRYLRLVRRTIYSAPTTAPEAVASSNRHRGTDVTLNWIDAVSAARMVQPETLRTALNETRRMRWLMALSGAVYVVCAAAVVWYGHRLTGRPVGQATALAYFSTLPGVFVVVAFSGRALGAWLAAALAWLVIGVALLVGPLGLPWARLPGAIISGADYGALPIACIALLVPRRIRPLVIGFVSLVGILAVVTIGSLLVLSINVDDIGKVRAIVWIGGLAATVLGIGLTVWQIRKGLRLWYVGLLAGLVGVWLVSTRIYPSLLLTFIGGIGTNGMFTLLVWALFSGLLRIKERGLLPDEILHFTFCWLVLTGFLPLMAVAVSDTFPWAVASLFLCVVVLIGTMAWSRRAEPALAPARLLLLRVFGREPLRNRLVDLLDDTWRRIGGIDLVVGADLAVRTVSAMALEGFLLGRVDKQFLDSIPEADERLGKLPQRRALDSRYPLNELHCAADVWQHVVTALARDTDMVLMDLRGLQATNTGAMLELSIVIERVHLGHILLLTDGQTDEVMLADTIQRTWQQLPEGSANVRLPEPRIDVLRCTGRRSQVNKAIANCVFDAAERAFTPPGLPAHAG